MCELTGFCKYPCFILKVSQLLLVTVVQYWKLDGGGDKSAAFDFVLTTKKNELKVPRSCYFFS